ncbi:hypothetical protein KFL_000940280 [Klebsormidium nitens]|uniref:DUF309 domain-containing protein n=1 Tax=Klebsormidium nitens TaxID=105231 RepID=A0A1Y1HXL6_KLENI|nr:hypothetical protein KFL_000940280 [Klebsormidium nitens]|eukprot:GAQ81919.1 hypothetical protein KFL_000940280 [Klebsormidium nitens]
MKVFDDGRQLFNQREFYKCHDVLEELWHVSPEPQRSVLHGILQCAVGLYHLQNQNHRGALIQFGEGLHKLRRQQLRDGPLFDFEQGMSALLEFVYNTQIEHAACDEETCAPMTGDDESYRLLGNFGAGQPMYTIEEGRDGCIYLHFNSARQEKLVAQGFEQQRVVLPVLEVTEADLLELSCR